MTIQHCFFLKSFLAFLAFTPSYAAIIYHCPPAQEVANALKTPNKQNRIVINHENVAFSGDNGKGTPEKLAEISGITRTSGGYVLICTYTTDTSAPFTIKELIPRKSVELCKILDKDHNIPSHDPVQKNFSCDEPEKCPVQCQHMTDFRKANKPVTGKKD